MNKWTKARLVRIEIQSKMLATHRRTLVYKSKIKSQQRDHLMLYMSGIIISPEFKKT